MALTPANQYVQTDTYYRMTEIVKTLIKRTGETVLRIPFSELSETFEDPGFRTLSFDWQADSLRLSVGPPIEGTEPGVLYLRTEELDAETISET